VTDNVYGAVMNGTATAKVHPVQLTNTARAPTVGLSQSANQSA